MKCPTCSYEFEPEGGLECPRCGDTFSCASLSCGDCGACPSVVASVRTVVAKFTDDPDESPADAEIVSE